jgi:hypothetical protein
MPIEKASPIVVSFADLTLQCMSPSPRFSASNPHRGATGRNPSSSASSYKVESIGLSRSVTVLRGHGLSNNFAQGDLWRRVIVKQCGRNDRGSVRDNGLS